MVLARFGGAPFEASYRTDIILYGIDYYVDRAMELAAMRAADTVVFPSEWMRKWTCSHQSFCDDDCSLVIPPLPPAPSSRSPRPLGHVLQPAFLDSAAGGGGSVPSARPVK